MENFTQRINKSRSSLCKSQRPFPNIIRNESGGSGESLLFQIGNLEEHISKIKKDIISLNSLKSEQNKKSFLDIPEIERIIVNWNTHNFNPNEKVKQKWKNNYDQINKNNGNICPNFEELLINIQTIYSRLTKNERNSSHYICQRLKREYYNNSNYSENYSQTTSIEYLQKELKNLEAKSAKLQKANQDEIDKNNDKNPQNNSSGHSNNNGRPKIQVNGW